MNKKEAKATIEKLVGRFDSQIDDYKKSSYQETTTRIDFINPLFETLGWDINNKLGLLVKQRDVIHEDKIKIGGVTKAPDYCFTIEGIRKFFLEAKRPGINIKEHIDPAYQLRRYGWNAKMPVSILTDFEEFSVYDCAVMPYPNDRAVISRIKYFTYKDYIPEFDFLWDTFSKENVIAGSLDKYAVVNKSKKGTEGVDAEFLKSLNSWRDVLARNLVLRNNNINEDELNYSIQKIIDRIIFLRICEDRGIEPELQLFNSIGTNTYNKLKNIFNIADQKYNSGLFDFRKDVITGKLNVDDKALKTIIEEMYYPKSPYEFSVIPVEILGHSYEQYLGKVIKIDEKHKISIDEKPEVRKAGGVYYTPQYIVDYIVKNTVGKIVDGRTPDEITKIKIVDPACGSGSFLLGAYKYLLEWHLQYYQNAKLKNKAQYLTNDGRLTNEIKKKILTNNIFGVDIDTNAVEVTKLSLMLQVMEGETSVSIDHHSQLIQHRVLPSLDKNILSGNSLIDFDFYDNQIDFEPGAEKKIKPFNWQNSFPEVFKQGGFDVVIGNPPYIRIQTMTEYMPKPVIDYYKNRYVAGQGGNIDIYVIFIEKAYNLLNKNGVLGFIQPHKFFQSDFGLSLRDYLSERKAIDRIIHFGANQIFDNATTYTSLLFLNKLQNNDFDFLQVNEPKEWNSNQNAYPTFKVKQPAKGAKWNFTNNRKQDLLDKLNDMPVKLKDITRKIFQGIATSSDRIYVMKIIEEKESSYKCFSVSLDREIEIEKGLVKPFLMGKDVKRYENIKAKNVVIFPYLISTNKPKLMDIKYIQYNFPKGWEYLTHNQEALENRERGRMKVEGFYAYIYPKNLIDFDCKKILTPEISLGCNMTFDEEGILYHTTKVYSFVFKENFKDNSNFYLSILNSKLMWFYLQSTGYVLRGGFFTFKTQYLNPFPIPQNATPETQNQLVSFVEQMLQLNKDLQKATLPEQKEQIQARIKYTDKKIDRLVYELYELTEEEIKIVEGEG